MQLTVKKILGPLIHTHWGKRIMLAARRGTFTVSDNDCAGDWPTCACGKMYARKPYKKAVSPVNLVPEDGCLLSLGKRFFFAVETNDFAEAAELLVEIEKRGNEIMKKQRKRRK